MSFWFDWNRERHNEELARKELAPLFLWRKLSYLTGYESGDLIYDQILKWKRVRDAAVCFNGLLKNAEKTLDQLGYTRRRKHGRHKKCPVCGRNYSLFPERDQVMEGWDDGQPYCNHCRDNWTPQFRVHNARLARERRIKKQHAEKNEQIATETRRKLFAKWILSRKLPGVVYRSLKARRPMAGVQEAVPSTMGGDGT